MQPERDLRPGIADLAVPLGLPVLAALLVLIGGFQLAHDTRQSLAQQERSRVRDIQASVTSILGQLWITPWQETLQGMASTSALRCHVQKNDPACLERLHREWNTLLRTDPRIFFIYYGLPDGRVEFAPPSGPLPDDFNTFERPWYQAGIAHRDQVIWTLPFREVITGQLTISAVAPIRIHGEYRGMMVADISLQGLRDILRSIPLPEGSSLVLHAAEGQQIAARFANSQHAALLEDDSISPGHLQPSEGSIEIDKTAYRLVRNAALPNGWHFDLLIPMSTPRQKSAAIELTALIGSLLILGLTAGLNTWRMVRNRKRLSGLVTYIDRTSQQGGAEVQQIFFGQNEYAVLNQHFNRAIQTVRELEQVRSRQEKDSYQLAFLRAQINPHFLHNSLNTIINVSRTDAQAARRLLTHLSQYLRHSFDFWSTDQLVPLSTEIELLEAWLAIVQARYGHQIEVCFDIDAPPHSMIPTAMLQPIVENAFCHGVLRNANSGGCIDIAVRLYEDRLHFLVEDDGPGIHPGRKAHSDSRQGISIDNISQRLWRMYGEILHLENRSTRGTRVSWTVHLNPTDTPYAQLHSDR